MLWSELTHWGWVTQICVTTQAVIGSDNGLSPVGRQVIIWTNAVILSTGPPGTQFNQIVCKMLPFKKMRLKMSSGKCWPFCLSLNVLNIMRPEQNDHYFPGQHFQTHYLKKKPFCTLFKISLKFIPIHPVDNMNKSTLVYVMACWLNRCQANINSLRLSDAYNHQLTKPSV